MGDTGEEKGVMLQRRHGNAAKQAGSRNNEDGDLPPSKEREMVYVRLSLLSCKSSSMFPLPSQPRWGSCVVYVKASTMSCPPVHCLVLKSMQMCYSFAMSYGKAMVVCHAMPVTVWDMLC